MVLLFNVFLTDTPANKFILPILDRGNLKTHSKLEITKYTLAGLAAAYPWKRAIINIELDFSTGYTTLDLEDIQDYVSAEFKGVDVLFSSKRNLYQKDWQKTYDDINDDFVFYLGNHDHAFLASDNSYLQDLVSLAKTSYGKYATIIASHWPENMRWAKCGYIQLDENNPREENKKYAVHETHLHYEKVHVDSMNIITKELYHNWFFTGDWGDIKLPRTEGIGEWGLPQIRDAVKVPLPVQDIIIPLREQFRHFDGYMHQRIPNEICPSLEIPTGFFESNIKIRYGYEDYKQGWVNINPKTKNYYAIDSSQGTDYKFTLEDLPLVWKNKISKIDCNPDINAEEMIQHTLHNLLTMIYSDVRYNPHIEQEASDAAMKSNLQKYKNYKLSGEQ